MKGFYDSVFDVDRNGSIDAFEFGMMIHEMEREYKEIMGRGKRDDFIFDDDDEFDDDYDDDDYGDDEDEYDDF